MKQLTKKQKIYVLKEMIRYYENYSKARTAYGLCALSKNIVIKDLNIPLCLGIVFYFPELHENKPKSSYAKVYWWDVFNPKPRLAYCKKILKIIEKS